MFCVLITPSVVIFVKICTPNVWDNTSLMLQEDYPLCTSFHTILKIQKGFNFKCNDLLKCEQVPPNQQSSKYEPDVPTKLTETVSEVAVEVI